MSLFVYKTHVSDTVPGHGAGRFALTAPSNNKKKQLLEVLRLSKVSVRFFEAFRTYTTLAIPLPLSINIRWICVPIVHAS